MSTHHHCRTLSFAEGVGLSERVHADVQDLRLGEVRETLAERAQRFMGSPVSPYIVPLRSAKGAPRRSRAATSTANAPSGPRCLRLFALFLLHT